MSRILDIIPKYPYWGKFSLGKKNKPRCKFPRCKFPPIRVFSCSFMMIDSITVEKPCCLSYPYSFCVVMILCLILSQPSHSTLLTDYNSYIQPTCPLIGKLLQNHNVFFTKTLKYYEKCVHSSTITLFFNPLLFFRLILIY